VIPPALRARVEAGVAILQQLNGTTTPLEQIVWEIWQAMRSVRRPVGRPVYDESMFATACDLVRGGESLSSVRRRFGFGSSVAQRIKREVRDETSGG
jgi:hypothetical protein